MLLGLRSLFEPETPPVVVIPPAGRKFKGHTLGQPVVRKKGIANLTGAEVKLFAGQLSSSGRAATILPSIQMQFEIGNVQGLGKASVPLKGSEFKLSRGNVSPFAINDDDEAAILILSNQ